MKRIIATFAILALGTAMAFLLAIEAIARLLVYLFLGGFL